MLKILRDWYKKNFSDPQAVILALVILSGIAVIFFLGNALTPVLAGIVIAYVLEGLVGKICRLGVPRSLSVIISFSLFVASIVLLLFGLIPLVSRQISQLITNLPAILNKVQQLVLILPEKYPMLGIDNLKEMVSGINAELVSLGQTLLSASLSSVIDVFTLAVFFIVVPLLVFFLLRDKEKIMHWLQRFLPEGRGLAYEVWRDIDVKMGNYIRGKLVEILIVGVVTYIAFMIMGLNYAATLSLFVGLSVIIPYVGALAVTFPIALIAWFQWGASSEFVYVIVIYMIIQFIDGNILVPLLFSEVVNMHPAAIIIAVLVFGNLWGFWGVFFAIPLATLIQSVLNAWPAMQAHKKTG